MKLVTFDEGRVGRLDGDMVIELDCKSTRQWFERGGDVAETGELLPLAGVRLRAPIARRNSSTPPGTSPRTTRNSPP